MVKATFIGQCLLLLLLLECYLHSDKQDWLQIFTISIKYRNIYRQLTDNFTTYFTGALYCNALSCQRILIYDCKACMVLSG